MRDRPHYRRISNISIDHLPSPAHDEHLTLMTSRDARAEEQVLSSGYRPSELDAKPKPTVHYPDHIIEPMPSYDIHNDSPVTLGSGTPSLVGTEDEGYSEESYDWSGEEDLVDEEAKFAERMGVKSKPKPWGFRRILTLLFSSLIGSNLLAGILITPGILVHFYWYKPHPTVERLYIKQNIQAWLFWAAANILLSWYLALIVDIIPVFIRFALVVSWGHISEYVKTRIEGYDSVKDTFKPLLYAASGWVSWVIIFGHIFNLYDTENVNNSQAHYSKKVFQVIEFFFFFSLVICAQKTLSQVIAFGFHRTAYKERIDKVSETLLVIEKLRNYRPKPSSRTSGGAKSGGRTPVFGNFSFGVPFNDKEHFNFLHGALKKYEHRHGHHNEGHDGDVEDHDTHGSGSQYTGRRAKGKGRYSRLEVHATSSSTPESVGTPAQVQTPTPSSHHYPPHPGQHPTSDGNGDTPLLQAAKAIKTAVLHDARNIKGKDNASRTMSWSVNSAHEAKRLARAIYMRFRDRRRTYLIPADFYPAFPDTEAAEAAFRIFDKDNNRDISRAEIKTTLLKVYKERRFLSRSMRDVSVALKTLDHILLFFAFAALFLISLSVFDVKVGTSLTSVYSVGIAASFIFKNAASNAFDAIMFLFVTHPFDTGDRCFIDDEILVVKKMGLFATVFSRVDGTETYYFNSQLFVKFITNVRRSGKTPENLTMQVAWRTPLEKLDALERCLNDWLATEENRWFEPSTGLTLQKIDFQRYLEITIGIPHNSNWQDWNLRMARKTAFHAAVQYYCRQLGIIGYESPLPIVYADPVTQTYNPPSPSFEDEYQLDSPFSASPRSSPAQERASEGIEVAAREPEAMKPTLGFLPPPALRSTTLRARKSKGRKAMMRGMGANG